MFNTLNHELDSSFLNNTIDDYVKICKAYDRPNFEEFKSQINQFAQNRPQFVMQKLTKYFIKKIRCTAFKLNYQTLSNTR